MTQEELNEILIKHRKWLNNEPGGVYADLGFANLRNANSRNANLRNANLRYADLRYANLRGTDLRYADLQYANLRGTNLRYANLQYANLQGVNLQYADLQSAYLQSAYLQSAKGIMLIQNSYPYQCYAYIHNNESRVRLGCYDRTIEEWDADFWNNNKEFPEGSPLGQIRKLNYETLKNWLLQFNKEL